jgi:hypothetical protein
VGRSTSRQPRSSVAVGSELSRVVDVAFFDLGCRDAEHDGPLVRRGLLRHDGVQGFVGLGVLGASFHLILFLAYVAVRDLGGLIGDVIADICAVEVL